MLRGGGLVSVFGFLLFFFNLGHVFKWDIFLFLFHLTFLLSLLVGFVMHSVGINICSTPSHVHKEALGPSLKWVDWGLP